MNRRAHPMWIAVLGVIALPLLIASTPTGSRSACQLPVPRIGPLSGKIVLPDGEPAANVRLSLVKTSFPDAYVVAETKSDGLGAFAFATPPWPEINEQELVLVAEAAGYGLSFRGLADWNNGDKLKMAAATDLHMTLLEPMGKPATGVKIWPEFLIFQKGERTQFLTLPTSMCARYTAKCQAGAITIKGLPRGADMRLAHDSPIFARFMFDQRVALAYAPVTDAGIWHFAIGSSLSGRVTSGPAGEPVVGVRVNAQEAFDSEKPRSGSGYGSALTDKDGNYTISQLSPGKYNLNVLLQGQRDRDWTCVAFDSTPLKEGEKRTGLDLKLIKGGLVIGTVTFDDGKPIENAHVGVYGPARPRSGAWVQTATTDAKGHYILRVPPGLNHVYVAGVPGLDRPIRDMRNVTVVEGKEQTVDFTVAR